MIGSAIRQLLFLLLIAAIPAAVSGLVQLKWTPKKEEPLAAGEVRLATAQLWGDKVVWVDARSAAKYGSEHIPGAINLNAEQWESLVAKFLDEWDPEKTVVVYDDLRTGDASHEVAERLRKELQIPNVYVLKGGWTAWLNK